MNDYPRCTLSDLFTRVAGEHMNMRTNLTLGITSPVLLETILRLTSTLAELFDTSTPDMFLDAEFELIQDVLHDLDTLRPEIRDLGIAFDSIDPETGDYPHE